MARKYHIFRLLKSSIVHSTESAEGVVPSGFPLLKGASASRASSILRAFTRTRKGCSALRPAGSKLPLGLGLIDADFSSDISL